MQFVNHTRASFARKYLGENIWNDYYKFCFERNPFDKAISRYYWSTYKIDQPPKIEDYLETAPILHLSNWSTYAIDGAIVVDFVGLYERLTEDLESVKQKVGIPTEIDLPHAKGNYRKDSRHYSQILNKQARARIEKICANEIATFSYSWSDSVV